MLSKSFLVLLGTAALIALPVTEFFFVKYALGYYGETAPIPWPQLIAGVLCVFGLAFTMVMVNTMRTARTNPATVLKSE